MQSGKKGVNGPAQKANVIVAIDKATVDLVIA